MNPPQKHTTHTPPVPQKEHYVGIYRALAFLVYVAVGLNKQVALCERIRAINGESQAEKSEIFTPELLKDNGNSLNKHDVKCFLDWFLGMGLIAVSSAGNIRAQLRVLKLERLAKIHVMCQDGQVPSDQSMLDTSSI
jgi:hypothetical protein